MEVSARRDCGYPGISPKECAARNCCFTDSIPQVPWCFFPLPTHGNVTVGPHLAPARRAFPGSGEGPKLDSGLNAIRALVGGPLQEMRVPRGEPALIVNQL